jgi:hypothetical protein
MATLVPVTQRQCFKCRECGTLVTWWHNRNGKPVLVEVHSHPSEGLVYRTGIGAYGNLTPWHKCGEVRERQARGAAERREESLKAVRDAVARDYLPRLMEVAKGFTEDRRTEAEALADEYKAALEAAEAKWRAENPEPAGVS